MANLIYRTYNRGSTEANAFDVSRMLREVEHNVDVDLTSWSDHCEHYTGIKLGLPTERHHQILEVSLERLGYFPVRSAEAVS